MSESYAYGAQILTRWRQWLGLWVVGASCAMTASCGNDESTGQVPNQGGSGGSAVDGSADTAASGQAGVGGVGGTGGDAAAGSAGAGGGQVPTCAPACDDALCQQCVQQVCQSRCQGTQVCSNGSCEGPLPLPSGFRFYPSDHIWNTPVDSLPVHVKSDAYVTTSFGPTSHVALSRSLPINVVDNSTPTQRLKEITYPKASDNIAYPLTDDTIAETSGGAQGDQHIFIVNPGANLLYELGSWTQKNTDGTWSALTAQRYDLTDYALRPEGFVSSNAAGVAMAPGIIRYDEVQAGEIKHAMAMSLYISGAAYVWPARIGGSVQDDAYPSFGQRMRLKSSFDPNQCSEDGKVIVQALKKYGTMFCMNSGDKDDWLIYAQPDDRFGSGYGVGTIWYCMDSISGSDFEAVDATVLMIHRDSGQARQPP
jgi:hypothetical protein